MAPKLQFSRWRLLALAGIALAGGSLATAAITRSVQAGRRVSTARTELAATVRQLDGLENCTDRAIAPLVARRRVDMAELLGSFDELRARWTIAETQAPVGRQSWTLTRKGLQLSEWEGILRDLSKIEQVPGISVASFSAISMDMKALAPGLSVEIRLLAPTTIASEGLR